ncbi:hypothetical protein ACFQGT_08680 [Natrialbaceae archaeon GCM10025810]|uniref:hypothetical protein n=1 Tax=Halovalidus salilacus TaxID=3075124 RepID=UPI003621B6D5
MNAVPLEIARTESRRSIRVVIGNRTTLLLNLVFGVLGFGFLTVFGGMALYFAGREVAAGNVPLSSDQASQLATGGTALLWLSAVVFATVRTVTRVADVDEPACLLVSTSVRNAVVGLLGAELLLLSIWVVPPLLVLSGAYAYGTGTVLPVALALGLFAVVATTAFPVGFVLGVWIRHLITVYEPIARYRTPIVALVMVVYVGVFATGQFNTLVGTLFDLLSGSPLDWPGHLLLIAIPTVSPSIGALVGTLLGTALLAGVGLAAGVASARIHWFADPARTEDAVVDRDSSRRLDDILSVGLPRGVLTVAATAIRRTKRAPARLIFVAYPLFFSFYFVAQIVQTGTVSPPAAVLFCLYVVWGSGAIFTLNPLGDLGRGLPVVLTSTLSGRDAVAGRIVAGALVGIPVALLVSLGVGYLSPLSLEATAFLVAGTVVGTVVAPALATGVGTLFPRFGSVRVSSNREAIVPSKTAFVVYTLALVVPGASAALLYADGGVELVATVLTTLVSWIPGLDLSLAVPPEAVTGVAWAFLALGLVAPFLSVSYAVRRFDRYTLE